MSRKKGLERPLGDGCPCREAIRGGRAEGCRALAARYTVRAGANRVVSDLRRRVAPFSVAMVSAGYRDLYREGEESDW